MFNVYPPAKVRHFFESCNKTEDSFVIISDETFFLTISAAVNDADFQHRQLG